MKTYILLLVASIVFVYFGQPYLYLHGEDFLIDGMGRMPFQTRAYIHRTYCENGRKVINKNGGMYITDPYFETLRNKWTAIDMDRQAQLKPYFDALERHETNSRILKLTQDSILFRDPFFVQVVEFHRKNMVQRFFIDRQKIIVDVRYNTYCILETGMCEGIGM